MITMPTRMHGINALPAASRIIIYGAGKIGQDFVERLSINPRYKVVAIADRDVDTVKLVYQDFTVIAPNDIKRYEFDYIIIAVANRRIVDDTLIFLSSLGVERENIFLWNQEYEECDCRKYEFEVQKFITRNFNKNRKAWLFMLPEHGNMGDYALGYAEESFLKKFFPHTELIRVTTTEWKAAKELIIALVSPDDVIFMNGGGYIGDLWGNTENYRSIVEAFPENSIFFFPNTLTYKHDDFWSYEPFQNDTRWFSSRKNIYIMFRDRRSYTLFKKVNSNCYHFPDMVLFMKKERQVPLDDFRVLLCLRNDREKIIDNSSKILRGLDEAGIAYDVFDICLPKYVSQERGIAALDNIIKKMQGYTCVLTDRLHGMLLSVVGNVPCVAMDNKTHKVSGVYEWIRDKGFVMLYNPMSKQSIAEAVNSAINNKRAAGKYQPLFSEFEKMAEVIKNKTGLGLR